MNFSRKRVSIQRHRKIRTSRRDADPASQREQLFHKQQYKSTYEEEGSKRWIFRLCKRHRLIANTNFLKQRRRKHVYYASTALLHIHVYCTSTALLHVHVYYTSIALLHTHVYYLCSTVICALTFDRCVTEWGYVIYVHAATAGARLLDVHCYDIHADMW